MAESKGIYMGRSERKSRFASRSNATGHHRSIVASNQTAVSNPSAKNPIDSKWTVGSVDTKCTMKSMQKAFGPIGAKPSFESMILELQPRSIDTNFILQIHRISSYNKLAFIGTSWRSPARIQQRWGSSIWSLYSDRCELANQLQWLNPSSIRRAS